jgi:hypothetical protein
VTLVASAPDRLVADALAPLAHEHALELLKGMAVAVGQDVDVDFLLAELASGVRQTLDADRVSVLLLDDADRLSPAVSVARQHNDDLWQRFRRMPPIALDDLPGARRALSQGNVLVIDDASASPLVPVAWQRTFQLGSLAIAPLRIDELPAGLVAVEYAQVAGPFTTTQLALLEGMAALAGISLRGGRQRSQAQRVVSLSGLVRTMAAARTTRAVAEQALPALLETAKVSHGLFATLSRDMVEVVAVRGPQLPEPGRYPIANLPAGLAACCHDAWAVDPRVPVGIDVDGSAFTVLPIAGSKAPTAMVVLPVAATKLPHDVTADLQLMADTTAMALHAVRLTDDRDWHRRALVAMTTRSLAPATPGGVASAVEGVLVLLADLGAGPSRVVVDRALARATGLMPAPAEVARKLTRWRRPSDPGRPATAGAESVVPLRSDGQVVGALLAQPDNASARTGRVDIVTAMLGDILGRAAALEQIDELQHAAADAAAHRAVAVRAYREAGQVLTSLTDHLRASKVDPSLASARLLAEQARRLLRDATEALAPATARQPSLRTALASGAKQVFAHGGPGTVVRQSGRLPALDPSVQVAVVHATQRVLAVLREARAAAATVHIEAGDREVTVSVRADDLLTAPLDTAGPGTLANLRDARAWLSPVGGSLEIVHDDSVNRFVVRAPAGSRRPERPSPARREESREVVVPLGVSRRNSPKP